MIFLLHHFIIYIVVWEGLDSSHTYSTKMINCRRICGIKFNIVFSNYSRNSFQHWIYSNLLQAIKFFWSVSLQNVVWIREYHQKVKGYSMSEKVAITLLELNILYIFDIENSVMEVLFLFIGKLVEISWAIVSVGWNTRYINKHTD